MTILRGFFGFLGIMLAIYFGCISYNMRLFFEFKNDLFFLLIFYIPVMGAYIFAAMLVNNMKNRFFIGWLTVSVLTQIIGLSYFENGTFMGIGETMYWMVWFPLISIIVQVSSIIMMKLKLKQSK